MPPQKGAGIVTRSPVRGDGVALVTSPTSFPGLSAGVEALKGACLCQSGTLWCPILSRPGRSSRPRRGKPAGHQSGGPTLLVLTPPDKGKETYREQPRIELFRDQFQEKLTLLEARLKDLEGTIEGAKNTSQAMASEKAEAARSALDRGKNRLGEAREDFDAKVEAWRTETKTLIHEWRAHREKGKLHRRTSSGLFPAPPIVFAMIAIQEAQTAYLDALEARMAAEEASK